MTPEQDLTSAFVVVTVVMLVICLGAFILIKWVFPRWIRAPFSRKNSALRILARFALEPNKLLYVVRIGKKTMLLGSSDRGLSLISRLDEDDLIDDWKIEEDAS